MNSLLIGGLFVLLIFGCVGADKRAPAIGDSDISAEPQTNDEFIIEEDNLIPPVDEKMPIDEEIHIFEEDLIVDQGFDEDLINEEDIIEPV